MRKDGPEKEHNMLGHTEDVSALQLSIILKGPIFFLQRERTLLNGHIPYFIMAVCPGHRELNSLPLPPGKRCKRLTSICSSKPALPELSHLSSLGLGSLKYNNRMVSKVHKPLLLHI